MFLTLMGLPGRRLSQQVPPTRTCFARPNTRHRSVGAGCARHGEKVSERQASKCGVEVWPVEKACGATRPVMSLLSLPVRTSKNVCQERTPRKSDVRHGNVILQW
jgi:hypothetical protein